MQLETEDGTKIADVSTEALIEELRRLSLNGNSFLIVSQSENTYLQALMIDENSYLIEQRAGDAKPQFRAEPIDGRPKVKIPQPWWMRLATPFSRESLPVFKCDEVQRMLSVYLVGEDIGGMADWTPVWR